MPQTILIVEDDPLIQLFLEGAFEDAGYGVQTASSGDEAWAYLTDGGRADLVWTDLAMPGEIQGLRLVELAREKFPTLQIIVTSGDNSGAQLIQSGCFLQKPFDVDAAVGLARKLLNA